MESKYNLHVYELTVASYFRGLVGKIFKILPMYEEDNATLNVYLRSLMLEVSGGQRILNNDELMFELIVNLEAVLLTNNHKELRSQVFKCTNICNQLIDKYDKKE